MGVDGVSMRTSLPALITVRTRQTSDLEACLATGGAAQKNGSDCLGLKSLKIFHTFIRVCARQSGFVQS